MNRLSNEQVQQFWQDGYLFIESAIPGATLARLQAEFEQWKEESRRHTQPWGLTRDKRPRFDIEPGHTSEHPALRRIASPVEISEAYLDVMQNGPILEAVTQLLGDNIRFNNAKINSKQPGAATSVKFHQDFMFEPHTNDDLITVLYFLDEVNEYNGPLEVVPGSHRGPLHDHWHHGVFTGAVNDEVVSENINKRVACFGPAGSACLMHTRLLHGSAPNLSDQPRTLYICEYCAEDAYPLQQNHIPSDYMHQLVRGRETGRVRCSSYEMQYPEVPTGASFFVQQAKA